MQFAGLSATGRVATWIAGLFAPPYRGRSYLARLNARGYVAPSATIYHRDLVLGKNVFVGERVTIYQGPDGGAVSLGDGVHVHQEAVIETGRGGALTVGAGTHIHSRCQITAYCGSITIGSDVQIAPSCAFYPYDHSFLPGKLIRMQPLKTKGGIVIEDDAWLGFGVIVLDGVTIGAGAVVGAGSVVTRSVPAGAIAAGTPARILGNRLQFTPSKEQPNSPLA